MAKHIIDKNKHSTVEITKSNSEWVMSKGTVLSGEPGIYNTAADKVKITVQGRIDSYEGGVISLDENGTTDKVKVIVSSSGLIDCVQNGVFIKGDKASVMNDGRISAHMGVGISGSDAKIDNDGKIVSDGQAAIILGHADNFSLKNDGLLVGGGAAVAVLAGYGTLVNGDKGVIKGDIEILSVAGDVEIINNGKILSHKAIDNVSIQFGDGNDRIVNRGQIQREIHLGGGDDVADLRRGTLSDSDIHGGAGDDTFYVDKAKINVVEVDGEGYDTIRTSVSYTLADDADIEVLKALGKKALTLTGNDFNNILDGNGADNKLAGGKGVDVLWGNGGNDTMSGGSGADLFYFKENSGVDTVTDFSITEDIVRLVNITGIDDFADLESRMTMADADKDGQVNDTVIDLGDGAKLRLLGVHKDMLDMDDFNVLV